MALYTLEEFASYVQADVDTATATLLRTLATGLISEVDGKDYSDSETVVTPTAQAIGLEAAARAYRNPNGVSSRTESIDDYSATDRWDTASAADDAGVFLTPGEIARLTPASGVLPVRTAWLATRDC